MKMKEERWLKMKTKLKFEDIKVGDELVDSEGNMHTIKFKGKKIIISETNTHEYSFEESSIEFYRPEPNVGAYGIVEAGTPDKEYSVNIFVASDLQGFKLMKQLEIWQELAMQKGAREFKVGKGNYYIYYDHENKEFGTTSCAVIQKSYLIIYFDEEEKCKAAINNLGIEKLKILFGVKDE